MLFIVFLVLLMMGIGAVEGMVRYVRDERERKRLVAKGIALAAERADGRNGRGEGTAAGKKARKVGFH